MVTYRSLLEMDPDELERHIVEQGRRDTVPQAARRRALARVTVAAAAGAGLASTSMSSGAATTLPWLVTAKWIAIGVASGSVALGVAGGVRLSGGLGGQPPSIAGSPVSEGTARPSEEAIASPGALETASDPTPQSPPEQAKTDVPAKTMAVPRKVATQVAGVAESKAAPVPPTELEPAPVLPKSQGSLEQEIRFLDEARLALDSGSAARAMDALDGYAQQFPTGGLRIEAEALRIETLLALGRSETARSLGRVFLANHPRSPTAIRVQRLLDGMEASSAKK